MLAERGGLDDRQGPVLTRRSTGTANAVQGINAGINGTRVGINCYGDANPILVVQGFGSRQPDESLLDG